MAKEFKGKIELDIRDCTPDWSPYLADTAPPDSLNSYTFFPDTAEIPERSAVNFHGASYKILAEVQIANASARG